MPKYQRDILVLPSDTHTQSKMGLVNPNTILTHYTWLPEIGMSSYQIPVSLNVVQNWIWNQAFVPDFENVVALADGDPITVAHVGDIAQGTKYVTETSDPDLANAVQQGVWLMKPWMDLPNLKHALMVIGTGSHEGGIGYISRLVREQLTLEYPHTPIDVHYHYLLRIAGIAADLSHHGPVPGKRVWLDGNELRWDIKNIMLDNLKDGVTPPDLVARGHYHTYRWITEHVIAAKQTYTTEGLLLPSYSIPDDHARKATRSKPSVNIGMVAVEIIGGKIHGIHDFRRVLDLRREVVIESDTSPVVESAAQIEPPSA